MADDQITLMAHLMRRAGFGATRGELEAYVAQGYEATVEDLLHPGEPVTMPMDILRRMFIQNDESSGGGAVDWTYRMITTRNPLEEKLTLFWHGLFAVGYAKGNQARSQINQIDNFRRYGLGSFRDLLVELSRDPAMIFWLDNNENKKGIVNENFGRELLELFAMGIGSYTEQDVKDCARAFTGWTIANAEYMAVKANKDSFSPYGRIAWHFEYRPDDHDNGQKTFLGETGNFNGEDVIDIIVRQEATAHFIGTRLFQYFVADEVDDNAEKLIAEMMQSYFDSEFEIRSVLRTMFNSEYFRSEDARFARVKNPVELVVGAIRLAGSCQTPSTSDDGRFNSSNFMGQGLLRPPSVEGWHEGTEWLNSGSVVERVNMAARELRDTSQPGVTAVIDRLASSNGGTLTPAEAVDGCLDLIGPVPASAETRASLVEHVARRGDVDLGGETRDEDSEKRIGELLSLIASTPEFQFA